MIMLDDAQSFHARQLPCGIDFVILLGFLSFWGRLLVARRSLRVRVFYFLANEDLVRSVQQYMYKIYETSRRDFWGARRANVDCLGCGLSPAFYDPQFTFARLSALSLRRRPRDAGWQAVVDGAA